MKNTAFLFLSLLSLSLLSLFPVKEKEQMVKRGGEKKGGRENNTEIYKSLWESS